MAEDYLTDDEQVEQIKRVFAENWLWILAGAALGVGGWFGYSQYRGHADRVAIQAAAQFDAMTASLESGDHNKSRQIAQALIKDYPKSPYADQAQLTLARLSVDDAKLADAVAPLTTVMTDSKDTDLRQIARLRLARVLIDQGKFDESLKTLSETPPAAFAARYHEVRGDALYAKQDRNGAAVEYKAALASGEVDSRAGGADAALLELKLADLGESPTAVPAVAMTPAPLPAPSASAPPADSSNKAKP